MSGPVVSIPTSSFANTSNAEQNSNLFPFEINSGTTSAVLTNNCNGTALKLRRALSARSIFHKFIILGGSRYYKDYVLKLIIEAAHPHELLPVKYVKHESDAYFYARSCGPAVDKFCRDGLVITNPHGDDIQLKIVLYDVVNQTECNVIVNHVLSTVIQKRYNENQCFLNLKDFHNDPELIDTIFCPLSQPRIFEYIVALLKRTVALPQRITSISLANNELSVMKILEALPTVFLRQLNLSYNKFEVVEDLLVFRSIPLTDINLDNNPLCQQFNDEASYITKIRQFLPQLTVLDGVKMNELGILYRRNCLITGDGGPLVDQFLQHFFDLYDGTNRRKLFAVYHPDAQFSLTAMYLPKQTTSATAQLTKYLEHSRNLLKLSNYAKAHLLLYQSREKIIDFICQLPETVHDPHSFTVDLPYYTNETAMISVIGVFRDSGLIRSFHRSFLLHRAAESLLGNEWLIANEMLHVFNAASEDAGEAFKIPRAPPVERPTVLDDTEKTQMTEIVSQITDMTADYSAKCLIDCNWNLEEALTVFRDLYKQHRIPNSAFQLH